MSDRQRQKMADKSHIDLLGLILLCSLLKGTSGQTYIHVFSGDGGNVNLPCYNALPGCTSTKWIYSGEQSPDTVVLVDNGMKKNDIERHERLSLESDCSLNIYKATTEDCGYYAYRQLEDQRFDTSVYLHVLHVSPSSTQTEIRPGSSFTLSCQLYVAHGYSCYHIFSDERIQLVWVNKTGVNLQSDSRFQISSSPEHCISTLTTTLLNEDDNTEWRCQITKGSEVKTSVSFTVTYLDNTTSVGLSLRVIIFIIEIAVLTTPTVILLWIICERRADNRRRGQDIQETVI